MDFAVYILWLKSCELSSLNISRFLPSRLDYGFSSNLRLISLAAFPWINQKLCFSATKLKPPASNPRQEHSSFSFFSTTPRSSSNLFFLFPPPVISVQPFIYQGIYSYIYLKHRSIASDPGAPSSDSPFWDGVQAVPQEWGNAGQRQSLLGEGVGAISTPP